MEPDFAALPRLASFLGTSAHLDANQTQTTINLLDFSLVVGLKEGEAQQEEKRGKQAVFRRKVGRIFGSLNVISRSSFGRRK